MTPEENELLTRVGPGTPCGELLRRYWHPVAILPDLSAESPTKLVRILGEDLVLFRCAEGTGDRGQGTGDGQTRSLAPDPRSQASVRYGLLADHCPHRGASLLYGRVEERGIACAYHGWLYDVEGNCLETPAEPADSLLHLTVKHRAYPVRAQYGLYWAYLGPAPAPLLPRYDVAEVGTVKSVSQSRQDCNWLQVVENNLDQSHVFILHQNTAQRGVEDSSTARGLIDELDRIEYSEAPFGIKRRQVHKSGYDDVDLMIFPSTQRIYNHFSIKVPMDDTHTRRFSVFVDLGLEGALAGVERGDSHAGIQYREQRPYKSPPDAIHPVATYHLDDVQMQDYMVLESQGPIHARETERLGTADQGLVLMREILRREIEKVQRGLDPIGVVRDPDHDVVDTHIQTYIEMIQRFPVEAARVR